MNLKVAIAENDEIGEGPAGVDSHNGWLVSAHRPNKLEDLIKREKAAHPLPPCPPGALLGRLRGLG